MFATAITSFALTVSLAGGVPAGAQPGLSVGGDAQPGLQCRGAGVDAGAKIRYRTETLIKAPLSTVWAVQTDVKRWPSWQQAVTSAKRLDRGPLRRNSQFRWTSSVPETPVSPPTTLVITSTVRQLQHQACIRWTGPAVGEGLRIDRGVHVWTFTPVKDGVLVRTEETHAGDQIETNVPLATEFLGKGSRPGCTTSRPPRKPAPQRDPSRHGLVGLPDVVQVHEDTAVTASTGRPP